MARIRRPAYEMIVVVIVVVLTVVLGGGLYSGRAKIQKREILTRELSMLRSAIIHYKMTNGRNPAGIGALARETYDAGSADTGANPRPYIDHIPGSKGGEAVDSFGHAYLYDPNTGWVKSSTPGYEYW